MRKKIVLAWLLILFSGIAFLFWRIEWKYRLPTPVPENYKAVNEGAFLGIAKKLNPESRKPLFLHFFNPVCPCSRFNIPHVKLLVKEYGGKVNFAIVVLSDRNYSSQDIQRKFDMDVPVYFDSSIAASCGVYSTPQAVIIDQQNHLYYRGNYNRSRYCSDKKTEYARMALEDLLNHKPIPVFDQLALRAYGCELPVCTNK